MFRMLNTTAQRMAAACEKTRRLAGMITQGLETGDDLEQRAQSWTSREGEAVIDVSAARDALASATRIISLSTVDDAARAAKILTSTAATMKRTISLASDIVQNASGIVSNPGSALRTVGQAIASAAASMEGVVADAQRAVSSVRNINQASPSVESTALTIRNQSPFATSLPGAGTANAHLLVLTAPSGESFYFNLSTAGYDTLRRQVAYNVASQDRLTRRHALQAVSKGGENMSVSGAVFTKTSGAGQMNALRNIGYQMDPLILTTGYGDVLGIWYLVSIEEEQTALFADGMPRKQQFTLEFQRYGEDYAHF